MLIYLNGETIEYENVIICGSKLSVLERYTRLEQANKFVSFHLTFYFIRSMVFDETRYIESYHVGQACHFYLNKKAICSNLHRLI